MKNQSTEHPLDCRLYLGDKPCKYKALCHNCAHYSPQGTRILILKLGAIGDALRTTPILTSIARAYPLRFVTWVTDRQSFSVLENNPLIDRLIVADSLDLMILESQEFELLYSLDKAPSMIAFASKVKARQRKGYVMSPWGTLGIFNDESKYSLALGLDDDLKFRENQRTYPDLIHEMCGLPYARDEYVFNLAEVSVESARQVICHSPFSESKLKIGLNTGCGDVFATKKWPESHFAELAQMLSTELGASIFLLGGPKEADANRRMAECLPHIAFDTGLNDLKTFAALLQALDIIVTGDTMALHLALAVKTEVVALFGPTCHQEIDLYDRGISLIAGSDCRPCYRSICRKPVSCMSLITPAAVFLAIRELLRE